MTGLDKILTHIKEDASTAAEAIITQANKEANKITSDAQAEGKQRYEEINKQSELDVKAYKNRFKSAANLQERKLVLEAKQQIIGDIIRKAEDSLMNLSDEEYFKAILAMVKKYAQPESGQILFSKKDNKRLPVNFEDRLKEALEGIDGASLLISKETREIDGGFVLIYGEIEENCSFDALFLEARENMQDKVSALLFN